MESYRRHIAVFVVIVVLSLQSSSAYAHSSEVFDPAGDISAGLPGYYDIVQAKVTEQIGNGTFFFHMELADAVPATPTDELGNPRFVAFNWVIDTTMDGVFDYNVIVRYCSHTIQAPCVGDAWHWESALFPFGVPQQVNVFAFRVDGATVKAYVDPAQLGDPSGFNWLALTRSAPGGVPVDIAPSSPPPASFMR